MDDSVDSPIADVKPAPSAGADAAIRSLVVRLSRPHESGGTVIERAAILAEGTNSAAMLTWIADHDGQPEMLAPTSSGRGLHSARFDERTTMAASTPRRYVLPAGVLA
jgi:hypothetical protein